MEDVLLSEGLPYRNLDLKELINAFIHESVVPTPPDPERVSLVGWIARDMNGDLGLYQDRPVRDIEKGVWCGLCNRILPSEVYPNFSWESEAFLVNIEISPVK